VSRWEWTQTVICWLLIAIGVVWLFVSLPGCESAVPRVEMREDGVEFNWAIQGKYSQLDCSSQPGAHPWYIEVPDDELSPHQFFMGCRR
jgi:hypothetical protein